MVKSKVFDTIEKSKQKETQEQKEYAALVALPAGRRMLSWMQLVTNTWWFKFFSRFDKRFKRKENAVK